MKSLTSLWRLGASLLVVVVALYACTEQKSPMTPTFSKEDFESDSRVTVLVETFEMLVSTVTVNMDKTEFETGMKKMRSIVQELYQDYGEENIKRYITEKKQEALQLRSGGCCELNNGQVDYSCCAYHELSVVSAIAGTECCVPICEYPEEWALCVQDIVCSTCDGN